jgi:integrase
VSPRKRRRRHVGCSVEANASRKLRLRFRAELPDHGLFRFGETTALDYTPENRRALVARAELIGAEIRAGRFDYLRWFPNGSKASVFRAARGEPTPERAAKTATTVAEFYDSWIESKEGERIRRSRLRDYQQHFRAYLLPLLGAAPLSSLDLPHLRDLQLELRRHGLSEKTIRNIVLGSLKAMVRDARRDGYDVPWAFRDLEWNDAIPDEPDPFTEEERDRLLEYFHSKRWKVGGFNETRPHYTNYAFLYTLFYTGCRPSELSALRAGDVDLRVGTLRIRRSRHLGSEAAPKTRSAWRIVRLTAGNVARLEPLVSAQATPGDYLFTNVRGEPIDQSSIAELFRRAQRALGIRLRKLYATKHTYVSLALTRSVNVTWLSEQTGVALATLLKHYGRFMHTYDTDRVELEKIEGEKGVVGPPMAHEAETIYVTRRNLIDEGASPTGFEPVLPA